MTFLWSKIDMIFLEKQLQIQALKGNFQLTILLQVFKKGILVLSLNLIWETPQEIFELLPSQTTLQDDEISTREECRISHLIS